MAVDANLHMEKWIFCTYLSMNNEGRKGAKAFG
jgi:hypothetical protein